MCHLSLTSFPWSTDFASSFCDWVSFPITIQPRLTILGPYIDDGGYMPDWHFSPDLDLIDMANLLICYGGS